MSLQSSYIRSDEFFITVGVAGINLPQKPSWQSKEGGDVEAESSVTHPGGMLPAVALGGPATRKDCTVKRPYATDWHPFVEKMEAAVGNIRGFVAWYPLDANKTRAGKTITITGVLKACEVPHTDANAASVALLTLVFSCDQ